MSLTLEQYANAAQTTLNGGIDGSSNPVTITPASTSGFPASGNFRIRIDSELLLVTAVSGGNFTATRAIEGTTIAAHSNGATLTHVLTAGSLNQYGAQLNLRGTAANRPAAGVTGRTYYQSDGAPGVFYDNGTNWELWAGGCGPFTPPIGDFTTWINQGTGSIDETANYTHFIPQTGSSSSAHNNVCRVKTPPATPYTMTLACKVNITQAVDMYCGIYTGNSGSGKLSGIGRAYNFGGTNYVAAQVGQWTSPTGSFTTGLNSDWRFWPDIWMIRLSNNGTVLTYQFSTDFRNWQTIGTDNVSGYYVGTIDQIGFGMNIFLGTGCSLEVLHAVVG